MFNVKSLIQMSEDSSFTDITLEYELLYSNLQLVRKAILRVAANKNKDHLAFAKLIHLESRIEKKMQSLEKENHIRKLQLDKIRQSIL